MGKKSKMQIDDPILKKNFKYQKRQKQRQMQKKRMKQQQDEQQQKTKELRMLQKKVQEDIEKLYEQQKRQLINQAKKSKKISKQRTLINAFRSKQTSLFNKMSSQQNNVNLEQQFMKDLPKYQFLSGQSPYKCHFEQTIHKSVLELMIKQKKLTATMKMQEQIKQQIKSMFSVKKFNDNEQQNNQDNINQARLINSQNQAAMFVTDDQKRYDEALQEQEKQQEPYIIDKKGKVQTEIVIQGKIYAMSKLASQNSNVAQVLNQNGKLVVHPNTQQQMSKQYRTAEKVVEGYVDYIHVENDEEQTIQQFRKIVIRHMYQNQLSCLDALKENKKSKGFTNAKYLIVTPYVGDARAIFDIIEEFFMVDQEINGEEVMTKKDKRRMNQEWVVENKEKIEENDDDQNDFFRVGIKILPKRKKVVYFSNFDASDIIVASPIGLKSIINGDSNKKQNSFLSSVQIIYVDRASVIMMQNWDHLLDIFQNLNYMPKYQSLKNSINQIRPQYLELKGRIYRQNLVFTEFAFPELNSLKLNHFHNWQGCITLKNVFRPLILEQNGGIEKNFYKIQLKQPKDDLETRFEYFKRKFWDKLHNSDHMKKIVIFVNSYFQFVRLKGFLEKVNASFQSICQHTKKQKIQSRVSRFNNGQYRILLLTQRAYYFDLCQIKKQIHIYFYSLPKNSFIYKDMVQNILIDLQEENKIVCIYSKYDKYIVQRLIGSLKAIQMVKEYCTNVSFIV